MCQLKMNQLNEVPGENPSEKVNHFQDNSQHISSKNLHQQSDRKSNNICFMYLCRDGSSVLLKF